MLNCNLVEKFKLIFNFVFNTGKKKGKTIGFYSAGKNGSFIECESIGNDVGFYDKGKNTQTINCKAKEK